MNREKWRKVKLGEIGKVVTGKTPKTINADYWNSKDYMFVNPSDLEQGYMIRKTDRYISARGLESIKNNSLNGFSILVNCIGSIGDVAFVNSRCATNQQINAITNIKLDFNPCYVYYCCTLLKDYLRKIAGVTVVPIVNKTQFENIKILLPPLDTQERIASVLSALDAKIDVNSRIIAELESVAKLVYDYYFTQFDFPNERGLPYRHNGGEMKYDPILKREIPKDWEVMELWKRFEFKKGIEIGQKQYLTIASQGDILFWRVGDMNSSCSTYANKELFKEDEILQPQDVCVSFDGSVGKVDFALHGGFCSGIRKIYDLQGAIDNSVIYMIFKSQSMQILIHRYATGSNILHASGAIKHMRIPYFARVFDDYQKITIPIFSKMIQLKQENQQLARVRDWLLPMLMNGQVQVL